MMFVNESPLKEHKTYYKLYSSHCYTFIQLFLSCFTEHVLTKQSCCLPGLISPIPHPHPCPVPPTVLPFCPYSPPSLPSNSLHRLTCCNGSLRICWSTRGTLASPSVGLLCSPAEAAFQQPAQCWQSREGGGDDVDISFGWLQIGLCSKDTKMSSKIFLRCHFIQEIAYWCSALYSSIPGSALEHMK